MVLVDPIRDRAGASAAEQGESLRLVRLHRRPAPASLGFSAFITPKSGRAPTTALVVVLCAYPGDAEGQRRFNRWYNRHIPQVLALGFFHTGHRYLADAPDVDGIRRHWAFYETDVANPRIDLPAYLAQRRIEARATPGFIPAHIEILGSVPYEALPG
jgi:hypothetical protein